MATQAERISPEQAHEHMQAVPPALLVCAYDDAEKFDQNHLEGAISLADFEREAKVMPRSREIIFYCA